MVQNNYQVMSLEAIKYLCSVINQTVDLPSTVISDTTLATNTTFSSVHINSEMTNLENEIKKYLNTALAGLNKLTKEVINDKALVTKDNVLYLYKADDDTSNNYMQMMLINNAVIELGNTQVDMDNYYSETEVDDKFALKIDLETLTTSFNDLKDKVDKLSDIPTRDEVTEMIKTTENYMLICGNGGDVFKDFIDENCTDLFRTYFVVHNSLVTDTPCADGYSIVFTYQPERYLRVITYDVLSDAVYTRIKDAIIGWQNWRTVKTSVPDVDNTLITFSSLANYDNTSSTSFPQQCRYYVSNGTCFVHLACRCVSPLSAFNHLETNLPKPKHEYTQGILTSVTGATSNCLVTVTPNPNDSSGAGVLSIRYGTEGVNYAGSFSYPVAES